MPDSGGLVQKNAANTTIGKHIHNYSTFDRSLSYRLYNTLRFGDYTPTFVMEGVPTDEIQLNSMDRIDSLSLNAPFKGSIRKVKESFAVPNMAILPLHWDHIYTQPSNGEDVPVDANCVLQDFPTNFKTFWSNAWNIVVNNAAAATLNTDAKINQWLTALMRTLVLGEFVYSSGSLLNVLGYKASAQFRYLSTGATNFYSYDSWFDLLMIHVFSHVDSFEVTEPVGTSTRLHRFKGLSGNVVDYHFQKSFRAALELFRENPLCVISLSNRTNDFTDIFNDLDLIKATAVGAGPQFILPNAVPADADDFTECSQTNLNLSRILAYQLVCAHYYSNSSLDFMYSADIYRQYIHNLFRVAGFVALTAANGADLYNRFSWNGFWNEYDYLSGHVLHLLLMCHGGNSTINGFNTALSVLGGSWSSPSSQYGFLTCLAAWSAIFGYRKSLRYGDYFVGARPRPLAPVNTDVSVNNNLVSVVDITRNIQAQRFANAVMRSRQKIEEYVKSLFGKAPAPDYHNPFFLTRTEEMIFGDEVQNTGEAQINANGVGQANSRTANFASNISPYTFTFRNDDSHPCIYIQIVSFDVRRAYTRSVERPFLHLDRYDMFNPDFQYIGDQPVYGVELGYPYNGSIPSVFAYQSRDMEYKERFDQACSGFIENLPGWILTDNFRSFDEVQNIDSDFIRSYNTELDQFYLSLSGLSLGSYFHFTCITDNNVNAKRPMAVDPQILA